MAKRRPKRKAAAHKRGKKPAARRAAPAGERDLLTRRQLAGVLSVHMQTVTKWEQEGLPVAQRGSKGRPSFYRELEVRAWLQLREEAAKTPGNVNLVQDRARKERAQAALAEQAYAIRMRELLPRDEVERLWAAEIAAVRTKLLSMPTTRADAVFRQATTDGLAGVERALDDAVREILLELADPDRPVPGTPPPSGQGVPAAA